MPKHKHNKIPGLDNTLKEYVNSNRDNDVLRQAAKIINKRAQANPGSTVVSAGTGTGVMIELTAHFYEVGK